MAAIETYFVSYSQHLCKLIHRYMVRLILIKQLKQQRKFLLYSSKEFHIQRCHEVLELDSATFLGVVFFKVFITNSIKIQVVALFNLQEVSLEFISGNPVPREHAFVVVKHGVKFLSWQIYFLSEVVEIDPPCLWMIAVLQLRHSTKKEHEVGLIWSHRGKVWLIKQHHYKVHGVDLVTPPHGVVDLTTPPLSVVDLPHHDNV